MRMFLFWDLWEEEAKRQGAAATEEDVKAWQLRSKEMWFSSKLHSGKHFIQ